jgi:hypothetical protein
MYLLTVFEPQYFSGEFSGSYTSLSMEWLPIAGKSGQGSIVVTVR